MLNNALKLAGTQAPMRISRAGSRNRVPAGRVPAKLQAPGIGCLQACRHPAGTRQAPSRHPESGAGCLQAPAGTQQAPGIGCRVPAGTRQAPSRHPGSGADPCAQIISTLLSHCLTGISKSLPIPVERQLCSLAPSPGNPRSGCPFCAPLRSARALHFQPMTNTAAAPRSTFNR